MVLFVFSKNFMIRFCQFEFFVFPKRKTGGKLHEKNIGKISLSLCLGGE